METIIDNVGRLAATSKGVAQLLLTIGENRLELLTVEVQEELQRLVRMILLMIGVSVFGTLAGIALTASVVFLLKAYPPATVLLSLAGLYGSAVIILYWRLNKLLSNWQVLSASLDQIRKDRAGPESMII